MENYIVSARKYRPSTFKSVVGQKALTRTLKNAIDAHKLAHAYLFCGPRGVGKTSCARIFAKTINCLHPTADGEACNECESCRAFNEQRSYNILELDAASNNGVDEIRALVDQVRIPPQVGEYKVFIVDEVHMLSPAAFNAFLKTLEEPPHHAIFILATTEKHKILPTILSRCQVYDFHRITVDDIAEHLRYVAEQEGIAAEPEALSVIAQKADGGMRDALSIFDQIASFSAGNITYKSVVENLNILDYEYYFKLTDAFLAGDVPTALLAYKDICDKGFESQYFIVGLGNHFRNLLVCKDPVTLPLFEMGESIAQRYGEQAARCSVQFLYKAMELANTCDLNYKISNNKRFLVELMLIQLCQLVAVPAEASSTSDAPSLRPIKPATPVQGASHQPATSQSQAGQPASRPAAPATPRPSLSQQSHPAAAATRPKNQVSSMGKPPVPSIRINATAKNGEVTEEKPLRDTFFSQDELLQSWNSFVSTITDEVALCNTMRTHLPQLKDKNKCLVIVESPIQQALLLEKQDAITDFLRAKLKNDFVTIELVVQASEEKKVTYDAADIIAAMNENNPNLEKAIKILNLEME